MESAASVITVYRLKLQLPLPTFMTDSFIRTFGDTPVAGPANGWTAWLWSTPTNQMGHRTLLSDANELRLESVKSEPQRIVLLTRTSRAQAACPACGQLWRHIHSHYTRKLADLPWDGIPVVVRVRTRRFFVRPRTAQ